jgi:hypothetical protein
MRYVAVAHAGNQSESPEEADAIAALVTSLVDGSATWTDRHGQRGLLRLGDILVVAAYNAQVAELARRLPAGARVGTVDKFQGQEAAVSIYSMASSSPADAPRGMEFLYSLNRLNVATSRARCLAAVVRQPGAVPGPLPHPAPDAARERVVPVAGNGRTCIPISGVNVPETGRQPGAAGSWPGARGLDGRARQLRRQGPLRLKKPRITRSAARAWGRSSRPA